MLHAVIMAGGSGTRFWPESRAQRPKQFLKMVGDRTMLRATVDRLGDLVSPDRIVIATTAALAQCAAEELAELPHEAILAEPCRRNTAPCIGLAAVRVLGDDPDAVMLVMPADHLIRPDEAFRAAVHAAAELIRRDPQRLITFGIRPTYPAESFGYIERGEALGESPGGATAFSTGVYRVARFHEKPKAAVAQEYLASGRFYWNSGIFLWKARTILDALAEFEPGLHRHLDRIAASAGSPSFGDVLAAEFAAMPSISIDYAVMERAGEVLVIEAPFEWDDVGSWQALARLRGADAQGNTIDARHLGLETTGTIVRGPQDHLIVTLGIKDCIVVNTPDATLVADKHQEESIRRVVELLDQRGWKETL